MALCKCDYYAPPPSKVALSVAAICPSVRQSVCMSHVFGAKTVHFMPMVTIEHW